MTVPTTINKQFFTGNGITTPFTFTFRLISAGHLRVYVNKVLVDPGLYTVTINANGVGGEVVFTTAPLDSVQILLYRRVSYTQESALPNESDFQQITLEDMVDKLTMECQQLQEQLDRAAIGSMFVEDGAQVQLPPPASRRALLWHPDEDGRLINSIYDPDEIIDAVAESLALMAGYVSEVQDIIDSGIHNGVTGATGATGLTGSTGATGLAGADWSSATGAVGDILVFQEITPSEFGYARVPIGDEDQSLWVIDGFPTWADAPTGSTGAAGNGVLVSGIVSGPGSIDSISDGISATCNHTGDGLYTLTFPDILAISAKAATISGPAVMSDGLGRLRPCGSSVNITSDSGALVLNVELARLDINFGAQSTSVANADGTFTFVVTT